MNELQHHGILGMKWGQRRWQNPDGSLTPAGKVRYGSESDSSGSDEKPVKKSVSDMSNKELKDSTERLRLENAYLQESDKREEANKSYTRQKLEMLRDRTVDSLVNTVATRFANRFVDAILKDKSNKGNDSGSGNNDGGGKKNNNGGNNNGGGGKVNSSDPLAMFNMNNYRDFRYRINRNGFRIDAKKPKTKPKVNKK